MPHSLANYLAITIAPAQRAPPPPPTTLHYIIRISLESYHVTSVTGGSNGKRSETFKLFHEHLSSYQSSEEIACAHILIQFIIICPHSTIKEGEHIKTHPVYLSLPLDLFCYIVVFTELRIHSTVHELRHWFLALYSPQH